MTTSRMNMIDLTTFTAVNVDLDLIEAKLWRLIRFQGHPGALSVRQHTGLAEKLAYRDDAPDEVCLWAKHHDDHEAILGDFNGVALRLIRQATPITDQLAEQIDRAICHARDIEYPGARVREATHYYDKLAESLEWQFGLGYVDMGFHPAWPEWLDRDRARHLFEKASDLTP